MMPQSELSELARILRDFVRERDWEQFHSPKNLAMALMGEAGELGEIMQWLTEDESRAIMDDPARAEAVRDELADVLLYVIRIADVLKIDLAAAARAKMTKNAENYPVELARGNARKHTELRARRDDDD